MFDPKNFLKVSENIFELISDDDICKRELVDDCEEAFYRTIISRAYYAVYLSCRDWLRENGIDIDEFAKKQDKSAHALLPEVISDRLGKQYLFDWINDLRFKRRDSDYITTLVLDKEDARRSIELAKEILEEVNA
ncbi:MAG: HEPN domain-containing protein [Archaeoglobus sp.]|nr:HEPN domain-containing protein [Archaeoglobus sp.]